MWCDCLSLTLLLALAWYVLVYQVRPRIQVSLTKRAVFITGCDTGFGNLLAKHLDKLGVRVFAGCLAQAGVDALRKECSKRVTPLLVDVTNEEQIKSVVQKVESLLDGDQLWGVVNNAGIVDGFLIDFTTVASYRRTFEVNVLGVIAVSRAFMPLLKKSQGRIVNIASLAGRIAAPGMTGYAASKFAVEGFSDALRREMSVWGIKVCIIEPGFFKTPMVVEASKKQFARILETTPQSIRDEYGPEFIAHSQDRMSNVAQRSQDPAHVVAAIADALCSRFPKHRYLVGLDANILVWFTYFPSEWFDWLMPLLNAAPKPAALKNLA